MLSRVADSLYWMSRYLERAEHTARVVDVHLDLMLQHGAGPDDRHWARALRALNVEMTEDQALDAQALALTLIHDDTNPHSIVACVAAARENARQVREQISSEMWEQLNRLYHEVKRARPTKIWELAPLDFLQSMKAGANMFQGVTDATMTHGEGWQFIQAGRFLERAVAVSMLVGAHFREFHRSSETFGSGYFEWIGLLRSCTAFEAYCKAYTAELGPDRIAEFLVLHAGFPHSIRFSADALETALKQIGGEVTARKSSPVERVAGRLQATLAFGHIEEIMSGGLHAYLDTVLRQCTQVHNALHRTYITYPIDAAIGA